MALNMCLWQVSLAVDSGSLIGHLLVTFGGAPDSDVANSLDSAYLGPFRGLCLGDLCPGGFCAGGSLFRGVLVRETPLYDNEWAIHIILECILVYQYVWLPVIPFVSHR